MRRFCWPAAPTRTSLPPMTWSFKPVQVQKALQTSAADTHTHTHATLARYCTATGRRVFELTSSPNGNCNAFVTTATPSNFYAGKTPPEGTQNPSWYKDRLDLPENSIEVPPVDAAFRNFMGGKIPEGQSIPPLETAGISLKVHSVFTRDVSTGDRRPTSGTSRDCA